MKKQIFFAAINLAFTFSILGQNVRDCNELFDRDLKTKVTKFDREEFKKFIYNYLLAEESKRSELKSNASNSLGIGAIVEAIPINFDFSSNSGKSSNFISELKREVEQRGYVTDEEVNLFITEYYQEGVFSNYQACLKTVEKIWLNPNQGVTISYEGDLSTDFIVKISFSNRIGKDSIKVKKAIFDGCNLKYGETFSAGTAIKNNQSLYQHLKRISGEPLNISISFVDGIEGVIKTFPAEEMSLTSNKVPIGTIIISELDYQSFLSVNSDPQTNFDINKSTWAPCDGRQVTGSKYGAKRNNVPDLRGLFVRGINDMGVAGAPPSIPDRLNDTPNVIAGQFQSDAFEAHTHNANLKLGAEPLDGGARANSAAGSHGSVSPSWVSESLVTSRGDNETRPKNLTIYYYIKIN
jgi:hypothetical protein